MSITSNKQLKQFFADKLSQYHQEDKHQPRCPHFGECGGCLLQDIPYDTQIAWKTETLGRILSDFDLQTIAVTAAHDSYEYRLRMDYVAAFEPFRTPQSRFGLRKRKQFNHVIDLETCHLISPTWFRKVRTVYEYIQSLGIRNYDLIKHDGVLRYLVIRTFRDETMLNIVLAEEIDDELRAKIGAFALQEGFTTINYVLNSEVSDLSTGELISTIGNRFMSIPLINQGEEVKLYIDHDTFFQNNIIGFQQLLSWITDYLPADSEQQVLLDLYCGVGTIGLSLAHRFQQVYGIELHPRSVDMATYNAQQNAITNAEFFVGDAATFARHLGEQSDTRTRTAIVDPPRSGLLPRGVEELLFLKPQRVIYISCNPITQAQDLAGLLSEYRIEQVHGFDMFPHTPHLECVVVLERR